MYDYDRFSSPFPIAISRLVINEGITSIGSYAFFERLIFDQSPVTIPNSVTSIGDAAFRGCIGPTSVTIPNSVTRIGNEAFLGFVSLTSVKIPNSVTSIGNGAFSECSGLTSVTIPNSVTSIGNEVFLSCYNLTSLTIPNSVTSIGDAAFYECGLTSLTIPNSVKSIGKGVFCGCGSLTSVIIGNSVTYIGDRAFYNCFDLTSATIPNSVASIGNEAFFGCGSLTSVKIPNSVTSIGNGAFSECSGLKDVYCECMAPKTHPFSAQDVKDATLHVKDYYIESYIGIEPWSFFKEIVCDEIVTDFNFTYYVDNEVYKQYKHKYKDVITPEPFPEKEQFSFSGWSEIPATMPGNDVDIYGTFIPAEVTVDNIAYQIKDGKASPVKNDKRGEIIISSYIEDRGKQYPVTSITSGVFDNDANITSLIIPDGIEVIDARAFYGCKNIETIILGTSINSIGERAFANIDKMEKFTCNAENVPATDRTAFENSYINYADLCVPSPSVAVYANTAPWSGFKQVLAIPGTEPIYSEKCPTPDITYTNGKIVFSCSLDGVEYHYTVTSSEAISGVSKEVIITADYRVSVYASKEGFGDSEIATKSIVIKTGDVNLDGKVDVSDHVELTNIIMDGQDE